MAYIFSNTGLSDLGDFGCGSDCACAPCRASHVNLGERYVREEEREQEPTQTSSMGEVADVSHCPCEFERRAPSCECSSCRRARRAPRNSCRASMIKMFCPRS